MSRVELDAKRPQTPRFNMPFELGLTVAWEIVWFELSISQLCPR